MREILFRGKRKDTEEWVEGYLHKMDGYGTGYTEYGIQVQVTSTARPWSVLVIPETVGQYTGLTDKNGKRIFEGDIVSFKRDNALGWTTSRVGDVRYYDKLPIYYIMATTGDAWDWVDCEDIEVIGNIHDNPNLLKTD